MSDPSQQTGDFAAGLQGAGALRVLTFTGPSDGVGRTTLTASAACALLRMGFNVGVVDMDARSRALTRWLKRRERWSSAHDARLVAPASAATSAAPARDPAAAAAQDASRLPQLLRALSESCDTVLIDAPSGAGPASAAAIAAADIAVSLVAAEAVALDGLFELDEEGGCTERPNAYSRMFWDARARRLENGEPLDWVLARGRADAQSGGEAAIAFQRACTLLGPRLGPRLREASEWRLGAHEGLCALDPPFRDGAETVAQALRDMFIGLRVPGLEGAALTF